MKNLFTITVAWVAFATIVGPILVIWSLNTLFGLNIPTSFDTWLAANILFGSLLLRQ